MKEPSVLAGRLKKIQRPTRTVVKMSIVVAFATGGKKWSIIQITTKPRSVATRTMIARKVIVLTFTTSWKEDNRYNQCMANFLRYFLETEATSTRKPPSTKSNFTWK
jgi:hypothetical protein